MKHSLWRNIQYFFLVLVGIIVFNVILLGTLVQYNVQDESATEILAATVREVRRNDETYVLSEAGQTLLHENNIWSIVIDQDTGEVSGTFETPATLPAQFSRADILQFSRFYLDDYPVFSHILDSGDILVLGFPKDSYIRFTANYWQQSFLKTVPFIIMGIISVNLLMIAGLYLYTRWRIKSKLDPIVDGIEALPDGLDDRIPHISGLETITQALNKSDQLLKASQQFRQQWLAGITHDLKTPLSVIFTYANLLEGRTTHPKDKRWLQTIQKESRYIENLINDLNVINRLQSETYKNQLEDIDVVAATREFIVELINMNAYDLYTFQFNVDHIDHPIYVRMERKMFDRMLHNLIYNAINHNPQGCHIRISIQPFDHFTRLSVRDTGIGTSTERLQEVRSRLNQPNILTARNSGIGLIVVNQIATIHGGKLDLASEPGQYFEAIITLESVNQ